MGSAEELGTHERSWWKRLYDALRRGADAITPFLPILTFTVLLWRG